MKTRLHKKEQNCNKLLTLFTMGIAMLTGVVAMGLATIKESYHSARAVSYNDNSYQITLTKSEFLDNSFYGLYSYLFDNYQYRSQIIVSITAYEGQPLSYGGYNEDGNFYWGDDSGIHVALVNGYSYHDTDYKFHFRNANENADDYLDNNIIITSSSSYYDEVKEIIESVFYVEPEPEPVSPNQPMLEFVQLLVNGIGDMASGVASGVATMAEALFLNVENGSVVGLSVFGGIVAIFAGLALAVAITTKVYLWITSLGN